MAKSITTNQENEKSEFKGRIKAGEVRNSKGKGGFADNPENRASGSWKKEDTPRFKLEQMMKLNEEELRLVAEDKEQPLFDRKLAISIKNGEWKVIEAMMNQVYGWPDSKVDMKIGTDDGTPLIKHFVIPTLPADFVQMEKKD